MMVHSSLLLKLPNKRNNGSVRSVSIYEIIDKAMMKKKMNK